MAYADKSCDMRRCCIAKGGHVQWEGVLIDDDTFIMNKREYACCLNDTKERILEIIFEWNDSLNDRDEPYRLLYQDGEACDWDVKKDYVNVLAEVKDGN